MVVFNKFKDGKPAALTFSYDDAPEEDKRLVEILNTYGMKGTFHINAGTLGDPGKCAPEEIKTLYEGHEISCHGYKHLHLPELSNMNVAMEFMQDRKVLEPLTGRLMRGCSYAFGEYNAQIIQILKNCGMEYARTVQSTKAFSLPEDFMQWHPTCHHNDCLEMADRFLQIMQTPWKGIKLFYVWGHAYEFQRYGDKWHIIEEFCKKMCNLPYVWYATNIEIKEYVDALRALKVSLDNKQVYNPTATDVWVSADGKP